MVNLSLTLDTLKRKEKVVKDQFTDTNKKYRRVNYWYNEKLYEIVQFFISEYNEIMTMFGNNLRIRKSVVNILAAKKLTKF